jgi:hypothetical protein
MKGSINMRNPVGISMKKDEIVIRISEGAEQKDFVELGGILPDRLLVHL